MDDPFLILKLMDSPIFKNLADLGQKRIILYGTPCKLAKNGPFLDFFKIFFFFFCFFAFFYSCKALFPVSQYLVHAQTRQNVGTWLTDDKMPCLAEC